MLAGRRLEMAILKFTLDTFYFENYDIVNKLTKKLVLMFGKSKLGF